MRVVYLGKGNFMKSAGYFAFAACCAVASPLPAHAATTAPAFQLGDLQKIVGLSEPQISPDGKHIAVIVSTPDWKTDKSKQELDLVDTASGARRALTWKREEISSPRWSPDGTRLAFIARDAETKEGQLYVMPMDGGDALRVTEIKHGVDAYGWSPDGSQIAFVSADEPANAKAIKQHDDAFRSPTITSSPARHSLRGTCGWCQPRAAQRSASRKAASACRPTSRTMRRCRRGAATVTALRSPASPDRTGGHRSTR
jgi:dipeptidyl aminopeptidase/acylaminoacyl peptidase